MNHLYLKFQKKLSGNAWFLPPKYLAGNVVFGVFLLFSHAFYAQAGNIQWENNYGGSSFETAEAVQQTTDGGYIVAGFSSSDDGDVSGNNGGDDYWVMKLDASGNLQWESNYGGSSDDRAEAVQQTSDGGYIVAGVSSSNDGDVSGNKGSKDYWLVKVNGSGTIQWEKNYGGSGEEGASSVQQTADGGYIVAGSSYSTDGDVSGNKGLGIATDYWLVKLDASGNIQWESNYGGASFDVAASVQQTNDGGYIVAGESGSDDGDVSANNGQNDYWALKVDSSGSIQWEGNYGGSSFDQAKSVQQTADGGYMVAGESGSSDGDVSGNKGGADYWLVKLDASGSILWEGNYGGSDFDRATSVRQASDGGYIVAGTSRSSDLDVSANLGKIDYWILKLDSSGTIQWEGNYGGSGDDRARSIRPTADGGYIVIGDSGSDDGDISGNTVFDDFWILKLDGSGTTGVADLNLKHPIKLYPNPTQAQITVETPKIQKGLTVTIHDFKGALISKRPIKDPAYFQLQLGKEAGLYLVELEFANGSKTVHRVLKK